MKKIKFFLGLLLYISLASAQYPFGGWTTLKIETNLPANPIDKPAGGKLTGDWKPILIEEFVPNPNFLSKIDENKWNFGEYGDDGLCDTKGGTVPDRRNIRAIENPDLPGDGLLQMDVIAQKHDSCQQFKGGMGAEIKTFSNLEDFRSFWLYPNTYMELRVKQTFGFTLGVGIFLYPAWQPYLTEIDFCETLLDPLQNSDSKTWSGNSNGKQDEYSNGYIWGESYKKPNFSCQNKVQIKDKQGKAVEMEGEWLIWGLEWYEDKIRYYLNNELQREIDLSEPPSCNHSHGVLYYKPQPMAFRFTHGNVTSEKNQLPANVTKSLFVDYIRAYQPADFQVIQDRYIPKKICDNGNGDNISVRYYPDVIYEWSSPAFDFTPKDIAASAHCFCEMQRMQPKPTLAWGTYPVFLTATLPDGRIENHTWQVEFGH